MEGTRCAGSPGCHGHPTGGCWQALAAGGGCGPEGQHLPASGPDRSFWISHADGSVGLSLSPSRLHPCPITPLQLTFHPARNLFTVWIGLPINCPIKLARRLSSAIIEGFSRHPGLPWPWGLPSGRVGDRPHGLSLRWPAAYVHPASLVMND